MRSQFRPVSALAVSGLMLAALSGQAVAKRHRRVRAAATTSGAAWEAAATVSSHAPARSRARAVPRSESPCVAAFRVADENEKAGRLSVARQHWLKCARATCGSFLKQECTNRYTQLESDIPSVVPVVTDETGTPRVDVEVQIDGEVAASQLDGRALPLDPGLHEFTFSVGGKAFSRQKVMIAQGQRNRQISATVRSAGRHAPARSEKAAVAAASEETAPEAKDAGETATTVAEGSADAEKVAVRPIRTIKMEPRPDDSSRDESDDEGGAAPTLSRKAQPAGESHALSYALGGTGLAGIGAGALMIYWGRKDNDLLAQCSPGCASSQIDHIRRLYLAGDIAIGAGVASLAASYLVYKLSHASKEERSTEEAYRLNVIPTSAGAVASVSGSF